MSHASELAQPNAFDFPVPTRSSTAADSPKKRKYVGHYEILHTIGEGSFAKVKIGIHRLTKQKVAIKIIDKEKLHDAYSVKNIYREAQILCKLDHPNIVQLFEVMETKRNVFLVLEYAQNGELLSFILAHGRLSEIQAKVFVWQILSALEYAHASNIVHRDLKAENLLLDNNLQIKISDFGLSTVFHPESHLETYCGSPVYSAPELIEGKRYVGPEVDAWSLGINVYAMVIGDVPFADANLAVLYKSIMLGRYVPPNYLSADCKDFIAKLLVVDPKQRATIAEMKMHPWLGGSSIIRHNINAPIDAYKFRPQTDDQLDPDIIAQLEDMGFERASCTHAILSGKFNQSAGTYYLLAFEKMQNQQQQRVARAIIHDTHTDTKIQNGESKDVEIQEIDVQAVDGSASDAQAQEHSYKTGEITGTNDPYPSIKAGIHTSPSVIPTKVSQKQEYRPTSTIQPNETRPKTVDIQCKNGKVVVKRIRMRQSIDTPADACLGRLFVLESSTRVSSPTKPFPKIQIEKGPPLPNPATNHSTRPITSSFPVIGTAQTDAGDHDIARVKAMSVDAGRMAHRSDQQCKAGNQSVTETDRRTSITIDASLYIEKIHDDDGCGPVKPGSLGHPRTIRFAFHCTLHTTMSPDAYFEHLRNAFDAVGAEWEHDAYLCVCRCRSMRFEAEICKLPRIRCYGLRLKRICGDIMEYTRICASLAHSLRSIQYGPQ